MARFVVVVDTQRDFMAADGALSVAGAEDLIAPMQDWLAALDPATTAGVLFTYDTHRTEIYAGSEEAQTFPIHCVHGTDGWTNVLDPGALAPAIPAWIMEKGVFDMWAEDGLAIVDARAPEAGSIEREQFFARLLADSIGDVTVIGVAADYCVRWAIAGLLARGFRVEVPAGLTRGIARQIDEVSAQDFAQTSLVVA